MKWSISALLLSLAVVSMPSAQALNCDLAQYKANTGLTASIEQDALVVTWAGDGGRRLHLVRRGLRARRRDRLHRADPARRAERLHRDRILGQRNDVRHRR